MPYRVKFPGARTERGPDQPIPGSPISTTPVTLATTGNASSTATRATKTDEPGSSQIRKDNAATEPGMDASEQEQKWAIENKPSGAEVLLNRLLDMACTFRTLHQDGKEWLVWFGPAVSVTPALREQVTQHKDEIILLLRNGHPKSRRQWGEPERFDWQKYPGRTVDADESEA